MSTNIRFLPWVRATGPAGNAIQIRASGHDINLPFSRYGPGDVTGIGPDQITRREPLPNSLGMAPNLFPYVEFARPDFPWCVSPGAPNANGQLIPWIALLVVEAHEGTPLATISGAKQPVIEISRANLPAPAELALWTHVQVDAEVPLSPDSISRGIARILSPRALAPNTRYVACVVPSFEVGRLAGLGKPTPDPLAADPAWSAGTGTVTLPVFDHWFFTTTDTGDLETLARRLKGRDLAGISTPKRLDVGAVSGNVDGQLAPFEGALRPLGAAAEWSGPAVAAAAKRLGAMISRTAPDSPPPVGPPIYGSIASGRSASAPGWLDDLNLDPRHRAAANLGSDIVRQHQDELVDEAWRQVGDLNRARREHQGAILAEFAGRQLHARLIAPLSGPHALVTLASALPRIRDASTATAAAKLNSSAIPAPMLSPAFRRILLTKTPLATRRAGQGITRALTTQNQAIVSPGALPPAPAKLVTQTGIRVALGELGVHTGGGSDVHTGGGSDVHTEGGSGVHTEGGAVAGHGLEIGETGVSTSTTGDVSTSGTTVRLKSLPQKLTDRQTALLEDASTVLDARAPAIVEVTRPQAFMWVTPQSTIEPSAAPTARFARRVDLGGGARLRSGIGMVATPRFTQPVAAWLAPEYLLEGINIPVDTAGMLAVHTEFVEALMVGANHELSRELLWRGVPLDRTLTPLTRFFESRAATAPVDMTSVSDWTLASALGSHVDLGERVVLVLRSRLVSRLSETVIYLAKAEPDGPFRKPGTTQLLPLFRGSAGLDTAYLGFELAPADLAADLGWYVVIQELPHAPRFGFDEDGPTALASWNDLSWPRVSALSGYVVSEPAPPAPASNAGLQWAFNSAHMAGISLQHPIRVSIHSSLLTGTTS